MDKAKLSRLILSVLALGCWIIGAPVAQAHDGTARIELNTQQTSPGAELEIRGVNIAPEQPITLALIGAGDEYSLGTAIGDAHGDFVIGVHLPAEALAGAYTVRAFGANRVIVAAPLSLVGSSNEEGGERRDQSELMLEPIPRAQPASPVVAAPRPSAVQLLPAAPAPAQNSQIALWPAIALIVLAMAAGLIIAAWRRATAG